MMAASKAKTVMALVAGLFSGLAVPHPLTDNGAALALLLRGSSSARESVADFALAEEVSTAAALMGGLFADVEAVAHGEPMLGPGDDRAALATCCVGLVGF